MQNLEDVIDLNACPLGDENFITSCTKTFAEDGVLTLPGFLRAKSIETLVAEAEAQKNKAYFTASTHNVYLTASRPELGEDHVYNRQLTWNYAGMGFCGKAGIRPPQPTEKDRKSGIYLRFKRNRLSA